MDYANAIRVRTPFDETVAAVRDALGEQGFGVLTEIDVRATMEQKLGEQMEEYVILGACNPQLAHQALGVDRTVGVLLPCNVVVRAADEGSIVEFLDPQLMVSLPERDELRPVAEEAGRRLAAARESLQSRLAT